MKRIFQFFTILFFVNTYAQQNQLNFDGIDDYLELNTVAPALTNSSNFTIEFWVKANKNMQSTQSATLFAINTNTASSDGLIISMGTQSSQTGQISLSDNAGVYDFTSSEVVGDNICHHVAYVRDGTTGYLYIDGINVGSHFTDYQILSTDLFSIGQEWDGLSTSPIKTQFFNGNIDEFRIWNEVRTQIQLQANMNNELTGNETNLLVYYNFNQGISGGNNIGITNINDNSVNNYNATLYSFNMNGFVSNLIYNQCINSDTSNNQLNFDGINDYVELNNAAIVLSNSAYSSSFTVEFWMKANKNMQSTQSATLFAINTNTASSDGLIISMGTQSSQTGQISLSDNAGVYDFTSSEVVGDNICHHVAYVRDGTTGYLYIDGINVGSHFTDYQILSTDLFSIGQEWDGLSTSPSKTQFFKGNIDEFRIWNEARTQSQIQANMNNELIGNESNLLIYFKFNQGIAAGDNTGINSIIDYSINSNNGNLNSFTLNGSSSNFIQSDCNLIETGIFFENNSEKEGISIFPNPTNGNFTIVLEKNSVVNFELFNINGQKILSKLLSENNNTIEAKNLNPGIYIVKIVEANNKIITRKVTIY